MHEFTGTCACLLSLTISFGGCSLQVKLLRAEGDISSFLGAAIDPPSKASVAAAVASLTQIGALSPAGGGLTALGQHLALLPVDVRYPC